MSNNERLTAHKTDATPLHHAKQAPYDAKNIWHLRFVSKMADSFEWLKSKMAGKRVTTQDN